MTHKRMQAVFVSVLPTAVVDKLYIIFTFQSRQRGSGFSIAVKVIEMPQALTWTKRISEYIKEPSPPPSLPPALPPKPPDLFADTLQSRPCLSVKIVSSERCPCLPACRCVRWSLSVCVLKAYVDAVEGLGVHVDCNYLTVCLT